MHAGPRYIVISAPSFDGITTLDPATLNPKTANGFDGQFAVPTQNEGRTYVTLDAPVGRFNLRSLLRSASPALVRVKAVTAPNGGTWQLRSASAGEQNATASIPYPAGPVGVDSALVPAWTLTQQWGTVRQAGTTDAIAVTMGGSTGGGPAQIEIEVIELVGNLADLWLAAHAPCDCECASACEQPTITLALDNETYSIAAWECRENLNVTSEVPGAMLTLPLVGAVPTGAEIFISRRRGLWFTVQAAAGEDINGIANGTGGLIFEDSDKGVLLTATVGGWNATDVIPQLAPVDINGAIAVWAGNRIADLVYDEATIVALPSVALIAEGQMFWATNRSPNRSLITLTPSAGDNFDGTVNGEINLPNIGDTVLLIRDGDTGWRTVWSRWDRDQPLATNDDPAVVLLPAGWRGTRSFVLTNAAADVPVTLPTAPPVGCRAHVYRTQAGTVTLDAGAGNLIVGAGASAQTLVHGDANNWAFLEFEGANGAGGNVWSYNCCETTQARPATIPLANNTPVAIGALTRDVTIQQVAANAVGANVTLPAITAADARRVLKVFNSGTQTLFINPAGGNNINGAAAAVELPPGGGTEFQVHSATIWHCNVAAALSP